MRRFLATFFRSPMPAAIAALVLTATGSHAQTYVNPAGNYVRCVRGTAQGTGRRVIQCRLSTSQTFRTGRNRLIACAGGSWVRFHRTGAVNFCRLPTVQTRFTAAGRPVSCAGGYLNIRQALGARIRGRVHPYGIAIFNIRGALLVCTLATTQRRRTRIGRGKFYRSIACAGAYPAHFWPTGGLAKCVLPTKVNINVGRRQYVDCAGGGWAAFSRTNGDMTACVASRRQTLTNTRGRIQTCRARGEMWFSRAGLLIRCVGSNVTGPVTRVRCTRGTITRYGNRALKRCRLSVGQLLRRGNRRITRCAGGSFAWFAPNGALLGCRLSTVQRLHKADGHSLQCTGGYIRRHRARGAVHIEGRHGLGYGNATFAPNGALTACTLSVKQNVVTRDRRRQHRRTIACAGGYPAYFYLSHGGLRGCVLPTGGLHPTAFRNRARCMGGAWSAFSALSGGLLKCIASTSQTLINTRQRAQGCRGGGLVWFAENGLLYRCVATTGPSPNKRPPGSACSHPGQCSSGICLLGKCSGGTTGPSHSQPKSARYYCRCAYPSHFRIANKLPSHRVWEISPAKYRTYSQCVQRRGANCWRATCARRFFVSCQILRK